MLMLSRRQGQRIVINENIIVEVTEIKGKQIRLGFTADKHIPIRREETQPRESKTQAAADAKDIRIIGDEVSISVEPDPTMEPASELAYALGKSIQGFIANRMVQHGDAPETVRQAVLAALSDCSAQYSDITEIQDAVEAVQWA